MYKYSTRLGLLPGRRSDGSKSIRLRVSWYGKRVDVCLPIGVPEDCWDQDSEKAINSNHWKDCGIVNTEISKYKSRVSDYMDLCFVNRTIPSSDEMRSAIKPQAPDEYKSDTVQSIIAEFVRQQSVLNSWTSTTEDKFRVLCKHLTKAKIITFDDFTEEGFQRFIESLIGEGLANSTIGKQIGFLKWFLKWSLVHGYLNDDYYERWNPKLKSPPRDVFYLTWEELIKIYDYDFGDRHPGLEQVRDVFCFCAFTGLRHSDVAKLSWSDVYDDYISVVTQKTDDPLKIELNKWSRAILDKYKPLKVGKDSKALPAIYNQKANDYIKEVAKLANIDSQVRIVRYYGSERREEVYYKYEIISTHCARRTFVVNALRLGIPAEVIMKWTGHSGFDSMRPYMAIVDEVKRSSMEKFDSL